MQIHYFKEFAYNNVQAYIGSRRFLFKLFLQHITSFYIVQYNVSVYELTLNAEKLKKNISFCEKVKILSFRIHMKV